VRLTMIVMLVCMVTAVLSPLVVPAWNLQVPFDQPLQVSIDDRR